MPTRSRFLALGASCAAVAAITPIKALALPVEPLKATKPYFLMAGDCMAFTLENGKTITRTALRVGYWVVYGSKKSDLKAEFYELNLKSYSLKERIYFYPREYNHYS